MHQLIMAFIALTLMVQGTCADEQKPSDMQEKVLENFPSYSQDGAQWCSWVSAKMVLEYYGYIVPSQAVAIKTFKFAGQTWGGTDNDGLPPGYYKFYKEAIKSLSNNNLDIEETNSQDKNEIWNKIHDAIDHGYPIIFLSGGPWIYDATDFAGLDVPGLFSESLSEKSLPGGNHASVITGYSSKLETNNFFANFPQYGPLTCFSNLLDFPPVVQIHDPNTATIGLSPYWVSYGKFFEKTIGYPSVTRLLIVKPNPGSLRQHQIDWSKEQTAEYWYDMGAMMASWGRYYGAIPAFNEAIKLNPYYVEAWAYKLWSMLMQALGQSSDIDWYNEGTKLASKGRYEEALQAFDKAIELNPNNYEEPWANKGAVLSDQYMYEEALQALDKAIEINPNYAFALYTKGAVLGKQGKYNEALQAFDLVIEINPYDKRFYGKTDTILAAAWNNKGGALKLLGRTTEANAAFAKAKELGYQG